MNSKSLNTIIQLILIMIVIGIIGGSFFYKKNKLDNYARYTIGKVVGFESRARGGKDILFKFSYNDKDYIGSTLCTFNKREQNLVMSKRFIVKFYPEKPKINGIYFDKYISDTSFVAPNFGWENIPNELIKINNHYR